MFYFILFLILAGGGGVTYFLIMAERLKKALRAAEEEATRMSATISKQNKQLQRYAPIANIDAYVAEKQGLARTIMDDAALKKQALESEADSYVAAQRKQAAQIVSDAEQEKQSILSSIKTEAQQAADEAKAARAEKAGWEAASRAIRNVIEGYGDQYLVPGRSVLDSLAEDWGHKEAGQKLKEVRKEASQMVIDGRAAACDYAEANRRETAINFVIDAFNGRVDAILAKVRHDNFGKLSEQIRDIYSIVNHHGEAFKNARILPDYLLVRLDELRWAVAVFELKEEEKDEQAKIREQMREEERARREYEKAQQEAERQERELQRKMKEAEHQLKLAHAEADRQKLQAELARLQTELKEAEERGQRAISMAQQTRRGHVYIISNIGSFGDDVYKIGLTRRLDPQERIDELGDASVPFPFDVHAVIYSEDAPALETELHNCFQDRQVNKCNPRKEFFRLSLKELRSHMEDRGVDAEWTMVAEAREYRESLAAVVATVPAEK